MNFARQIAAVLHALKNGPLWASELPTSHGTADALAEAESSGLVEAECIDQRVEQKSLWRWTLTSIGRERLATLAEEPLVQNRRKTKEKTTMPSINWSIVTERMCATIARVNGLKKRAEMTWPEDKIARLNWVLARMESEGGAGGWVEVVSSESGGLELAIGYKLDMVERILTGEQDMPPLRIMTPEGAPSRHYV